MSTGWVWDERYMWHDTGHAAAFLTAGGVLEPDEHVERPATKRRLRNLLEVSGTLEQLTPIKAREATTEELTRVHSAAHVEQIDTYHWQIYFTYYQLRPRSLLTKSVYLRFHMCEINKI